MLPPSISTSDKHYKVILVLGRRIYKIRYISGEIPDYSKLRQQNFKNENGSLEL
jgi:hypothetical protein